MFIIFLFVFLYIGFKILPLELLATVIGFVLVSTIALALFATVVGFANIVAGTTALIGTAAVWFYVSQ